MRTKDKMRDPRSAVQDEESRTPQPASRISGTLSQHDRQDSSAAPVLPGAPGQERIPETVLGPFSSSPAVVILCALCVRCLS